MPDPVPVAASSSVPSPVSSPAPYLGEPAGTTPATMGSRRGGLARRILALPLVRLVLALAFVLLPQALAVPWLRANLGEVYHVFPSILLMHLAYVAYVRLIERRPAAELDLRAAPAGLAWGTLLGFGLIAVTVGIVWLLGYYRVTGANELSVLLPVFAISAQAGYVEEVITRGIVFRIVEDGLGTWLALAFSALLFGFLHGLNPNATLVSSLSIAVSAGVLLAAVYAASRRLWPVIGLHFGWNFTLGGIFGVPVSGFAMEGLLESETSGPELLTGGDFGLEASVLVPILCVALGIPFLLHAARNGRLVPPFWRRRAPAPAPQLVPASPPPPPVV